MNEPREVHLVGLDYLAAITTLLQRVRNAHPTKGLYEAAELHWWWGVPRPTDDLPQFFWFGEDDQPLAATIITDFSDGSSALYEEPVLIVSVMPDADVGWIAHVVERGLAYAAENGIDSIELEVDRDDDVMRTILFGRGFAIKGDGLFEGWLEADARPPVSPLADDYQLRSRADTMHLPHHMTDPRRPDIEERLQQTSMYRADLDLVVLDGDEKPAAYGMFWYDPVTATGVVEPMRTDDDHQQKGLARHILTSGIERLAAAGATRISIGWEPDNPASGKLYRSVGFGQDRRTDAIAGPTSPQR